MPGSGAIPVVVEGDIIIRSLERVFFGKGKKHYLPPQCGQVISFHMIAWVMGNQGHFPIFCPHNMADIGISLPERSVKPE
jgi:hypothetical protein